METVKPKPSAAPRWLDEAGLLRRPAAMLLGCVAGAALVLGVSTWLRSHAENELSQAQRQRAASAARLFNVGVEKQELAQYGPRFAQLQAAGMIGAEQRLRWIETVKNSRNRHRLVSADYEIEPQQAVGGAAPLVLGGLHLRASRMRLELGMAHELDLFNMLADLRAAGPYTVQECRIRRNEGVEGVADGAAARQNASCTLLWLTLGEPPAAAADAPATADGSLE